MSVPGVEAWQSMNTSRDEPAKQSLDAAGDAGNSGMSSLGMMTGGPPRYPPSSVKQWLTCPTFWRLSKIWEPRAASWTPHQSVGTAIHAGIASYLRGVASMAPLSPETLSNPVAEGRRVLEGLYEPQDTWGLEGLQALVKKGTQALIVFLESNVLRGARIVAVEYPDPVQDSRVGTQRIYRIVDCILEREESLEVWDWKSKLRLDAAYFPETQRAVLHSWQLLDYSWHVRQWANQPGRGYLPTLPDRAPSGAPWTVRHAAHGLVILGPKLMAQAIPITLTPERLTQWHIQAISVWRQMWWEQFGEAPSLMNWEACSDRHLHYGKECVFMPACHDLCGNESLFSGVYRRREKT